MNLDVEFYLFFFNKCHTLVFCCIITLNREYSIELLLSLCDEYSLKKNIR